MSELAGTDVKGALRHNLLLTVSAMALLNLVYSVPVDADEASSRPTVWIELGGQLDRLDGRPQSYVPSFASVGEQHGLISTDAVQAVPLYSVGESGAIRFQPRGSDWTFSASLQYGRSSAKKYQHQEVLVSTYVNSDLTERVFGPSGGFINQTADYAESSNVSHGIVDFTVGKDVGLGLLKGDTSSEIAFGVRFAQFSAHTKMHLSADPNPHVGNFQHVAYFDQSKYVNQYYQFYKAKPELVRNFHGLGPTLSWNGSVPIAGGGGDDTELTFDFGANLAILFGRQKSFIHHQTVGDIYTHRPLGGLFGQPKYSHDHYVNSVTTIRSRSVVVPNIGGLAGISVKFPNAKVSLGYRADFFFGAMDGGIDVRKTYNQGFNGPFASISLGLGG